VVEQPVVHAVEGDLLLQVELRVGGALHQRGLRRVSIEVELAEKP
jgi:hypothetical protein